MARRLLHIRVGEAGVAWLDQVAEKQGSTRSEVLRAALKVATGHEREVAELVARVADDAL